MIIVVWSLKNIFKSEKEEINDREHEVFNFLMTKAKKTRNNGGTKNTIMTLGKARVQTKE